MKNSTAVGVGIATYLAGLGLGYSVLLRKRLATWGANRDEAQRTMPGDELLPDPDSRTTRAITIEAEPAAIWPCWCRSAQGAAVPTPTTGSRTCSVWTCTAPMRSFRSSSIRPWAR